MRNLELCTADALPSHAVIVTVWRSMGRTVADITCTDCPSGDPALVAEFPRPVPVALERAEQLRETCGLQRIAVILHDPSLWRLEWGRLNQLADA